MRSKKIPFIENSETNLTNGIFSYIQEQSLVKDLDSEGIVSFTTNRKTAQYTVPLYLIDKTNSYWASDSYLDSYLLIDFKNNKVSISDYIIADCGPDYPREWKILGSNDKIIWTQISHETTNYPSTYNGILCLRFRSESQEKFRYIKLIQLKAVHMELILLYTKLNYMVLYILAQTY